MYGSVILLGRLIYHHWWSSNDFDECITLDKLYLRVKQPMSPEDCLKILPSTSQEKFRKGYILFPLLVILSLWPGEKSVAIQEGYGCHSNRQRSDGK